MKRGIKLIHGWGVNDVDYNVHNHVRVDGKFKCVWTCPYYTDWKDMIKRAYSEKFQNKSPNYKSCTICDEWKYLSNFIKWVDSQPNRDWVKCELDKDFIKEGNKHYSPETCVYIPSDINCFIINRNNHRGDYMLGVSLSGRKNKPYQVRCNNPFLKKEEHLGRYETEIQAHLVWKRKKHEHAMRLASICSDERVADRLRTMYSPESDLTTK